MHLKWCLEQMIQQVRSSENCAGRQLLLDPREFQTWDPARHLASISADDLGTNDENDLSKCTNDAKPGGVLSTEKKQDMLKTLNDLGEWNDSGDMAFKVMHACRD